jgi:hypothetical protein
MPRKKKQEVEWVDEEEFKDAFFPPPLIECFGCRYLYVDTLPQCFNCGRPNPIQIDVQVKPLPHASKK